jgi:Mrp family chromosome partitioning ATPase
MAEEYARIKKFTARVESYTMLLSNMQAQATSLIALEPVISRLQREIDQDAKDYQYYLNTLNQTRIDDAGGNVSNMSIVQHPTPPGLDTKKVMKLMGLAFGACVGGGLLLAFLLDFVIDRTIRRGVEVERHLRLPLLISIPDASWNGQLFLPGKRRLNRSGRRFGNGHNEHDSHNGNAVVRWDSRQSIQLYASGLRERLITYFEGQGANHSKPKRVAVTSCSHGAGVTTVAASLASALSRIPNAKVLLVDMNMGQGVARTFKNGEPALAGDASSSGVSESASEVQANSREEPLAVVPMRNGNGATGGESPKGLPSGLAHLAPQFEANDHDFIIFDLPPATSTSMTPRMAGYMDIVLLVLESEKTGREVANRAASLMRNSRANVAAVLNKYRKYVPERLNPEF